MSCSILGHIYETEQDFKRSVSYNDRACKLNEGEACLALAAMYAKGNGVPRDPKTSNDLWIKACHLGMGTAHSKP